MRDVEIYTTLEGKCPFFDWYNTLSNDYKVKVLKRINRLKDGNYGDWKHLSNSRLCEMRLFFGKGYRIYFKEINKVIILILAGSDKSNQNKTIRLADKYLAEYLTRSKTYDNKI